MNRYKWLVVYCFQVGQGRSFIDADTDVLTSDLILDFERIIEEENGYKNPFVLNAIRLEKVE